MKGSVWYEIEKKFNGNVVFNVKASDFTSYKTGGIVSAVFYPQSISEVLELIDFLKSHNISYFICGRATNILVSDYGFDGVFIKTDKMNRYSFNDYYLDAECGCLLDDMIKEAISRGLGGLENLSYIPGSIGGAVRMNAGAFESEVFDKIEYFDAINLKNFKLERIYKRNIRYSYRYVEGVEDYFITSAFFVLDKKNKELLERRRNEIISKRILKQPLELPSAGSVFKRPKKSYASKLIDECGLKGRSVGGAKVSEKHAGFIVNTGNATSSDIYRLINIVRDEVYKKTGIMLELEQITVGRFD
ncbi:MAG: UDP-N-acetylmuramate dehydrogenase [Elusimicrobiales bacterium]